MLVLGAVLAVMVVLALVVVGAAVLPRIGGDGDGGVATAPGGSAERSSRATATADEDDADEDGPAGTGVTSRPPTSVAPVRGSRQQPLAIGETFALRDPADGDVEVTINAFTADANAAMAAANQFNQPAPAGSTYTLVNATFTYRAGAEKTSVKGITFALSLSAFGVSAVEIPSYSCVAVAPEGVNILAEILDGGTVTGNTCFLMPTADATGPLLLRVQESWCFEDCDEYWIKLQ